MDAENKILRAQLFAKSKKKSASSIAAEPRNRAMDYHSLPGEQKSSPTKKVTSGYSKLSGEGASSAGSLDEEPVKLTPTNQQQQASTEPSETTISSVVIPDY